MLVPRRLRSLINTDVGNKLVPIHSGEILLADFIDGFGITQNKLAVSVGVPPRRINEIVHGKRGVCADTALRLAKYFGTSAQFWLTLQGRHDLDVAEDRMAEQIATITPLQPA
jgi:addiction module HigA family antidote